MTYYYVYETTNLVNGRKYIGWHQTEILDDGYLGSGKRLHLAIKKYGRKVFQKKILRFFDSANDAKDYERLLITKEIIESDNYYNLMPGGSGGDGKGKHSRNYGILKSNEHKKKLSEARKGRFTGESNPFYGKTHSDDLRLWMSERQQGESSPVYDHTIYHFYNHKTTEEFIGTQYEFRNKFNYDSGNVNKLVSDFILSYKHWTKKGNNIPVRGPAPDNKLYTISKDAEMFTGTRKEIIELIGTKYVTKFLQGKTKKCRNWILIKQD